VFQGGTDAHSKIESLRDQETLGCLCHGPYVGIGRALKPLLLDGVCVVAKLHKSSDEGCRQVLVQFDAHQNATTLGAGKSSRTESAANAITARTSSTVRFG
jgi:hypothetical protein